MLRDQEIRLLAVAACLIGLYACLKWATFQQIAADCMVAIEHLTVENLALKLTLMAQTQNERARE